jgi:hypothetical protein
MSGPYRTTSSCGRECSQGHTWCPRCQSVRRIIKPWGGWRAMRRVWFGMMALILCLAPILSFDYIVMTPTALVVTLAIGPLNHLVAQKPICRSCGLGLA